jgi:hypothetical protein
MLRNNDDCIRWMVMEKMENIIVNRSQYCCIGGWVIMGLLWWDEKINGELNLRALGLLIPYHYKEYFQLWFGIALVCIKGQQHNHHW